MFAILGVNLMSDKMNHCDLPWPNYYNVFEADCLAQGHRWRTVDMNFDDFPSAMLSLFELATQEGWPDSMWLGIDADDDVKSFTTIFWLKIFAPSA